jgi:DNA polymerase III epsilon subunit-like protein
VSNLIDEFDSNFDIEGGLKHAIIDIIESRRAEIPAERMVEEETLFQVAERVLESNSELDADVLYFNALREVTNFITFATEGAISENVVKHADLLPVSHPASEAETTLTASALRGLRAQWYAADPRIINEDARAIIASLYSSNPLSVDYAYNLTRLESLSEGQVPADLLITPLVAFGDPYAGKNSFWHRQQRAEDQRRDDEGQFAEMGGGYRFYVRDINGRIISVVGKVAGIPENDPLGIDIEVTGVKGVRDGIYTIPASYGHSFKAILPEHAVAKAVRTAKKDVPFIDIKDLVRKDLPTSWFPTKTAGEVEGIEAAKASRSFATGDGYRANLYKKADDALAARIADAQNTFGSLVISDQGTDTLNPDLPVYELISTKRGQPEVVGYAQDWASVQKLTADEDKTYPNAENEPIEESKAELPAPAETEVEAEEEVDEGPSFDPVATKPDNWLDNKDGTFTSEDGSYVARFGTIPVSIDNETTMEDDEEFGTESPAPMFVGGAFEVLDEVGGDPIGVAFDWEGVERLTDTAAMHELIEDMNTANNRLNPEDLLPSRTQYIVDPAGPSGRVDGAAYAKDAITEVEKSRLYRSARNHVLPGDMMEMYDEMAANWTRYNKAQATNLANFMNQQPFIDRSDKNIVFAQWHGRDKIRQHLKTRALPQDVFDRVSAEYRGYYSKGEVALADDLLSSYPLKKYAQSGKTVAENTEVEGEQQPAAAPVSTTVAKYPPTKGKLNKLYRSLLNHSVSGDDIVRFDDIMLNPENYDFREVQAFIDDLDSREEVQNDLATPAQRAFFRDVLSRENGQPWHEELLENMYKYTFLEADAKFKEIADDPRTSDSGLLEARYAPEKQSEPKKTADEIARENGMESAVPAYLGTDIPVGKDRPTNRQLVMLEALFENRDFSSKTATENLETFFKFHRDMSFQTMQDYINEFKELPFKEGFQPRQLQTNLSMEDGGPSPRMLRSLERKYAKGLIPDEVWEAMKADIPNLKLGAIADRYIKPLDGVESLHDDAILRKSIEGGYEIAGLRVPKNSTVEIPQDYAPTKVGQWIAPTEAEVDQMLDAGGATPNIFDTTVDPDALDAALKAKTSAEAEDILNKAEYDNFLQREALRADLRRARQTINGIINQFVDALNTPRRILKADARKILEKGMTDLSALKAVVDLRRKNIPNAREFDRRLNLIAESVLPLGEDGPSPYGTLKTRTPEVMQILQDARSAVLSGVGTYSAGRFQYQDSLAIEDMSIPMSDKPSMKFFYPPTFAGSAMEALKGASSYQEIIDFLRNNDFYVLDLETTGLPDLDDRDIKNDPIQVAVTKVSGLQVVDQFSTYINPESKISSYTLKGVGDGRGGKVTPEFLEGFPTKREAMEQLIEFMPRGSILVGHNALMFDLEVVERTLSEAGLGALEPSGVMDTLGLARYIMPEWSPATPDAPFKVNAYGKQNKSFSLEALVTYFGLSNNGRHEADADVASTVEVLQKMLDRAQRGLAVSGPEFDFNAATNGWTQEAYDAAKEAYKEQSAAYMISRSLDILSMEGYTPEMAEQILQDVANSLNGIADGAQSENRTPINIPAANTLRDLYPGSYVFDVNDGRVGFSLGIINGNVMTDMPSPEVLASGRFVLEQLPPSRLARVTDRFMSKNGVLLDYGMEVSSPSIPVVGTAYVRSLTGGNDNVIVRVNNNLIPINARDLAAVPVKGDSAATQEQESIIVNLLEDLVSSKIMDRATANGFQKAADGHFYTAEVANKVITRLSNAAQQKRQLDANSDISVPAGENAAPRAQVESIEDMAVRKPKDAKTVADIDKKAVKPLLDKLPKKPTPEGENIVGAIAQGLNIVVKALAGTGKTTNLRNAATALMKLKPKAKILYVVFNKENQLEANEAMPSNTEARTSDSISFRAPVNKMMREKFEKLPTHSFHNTSANTEQKYIKDQNTRSGLIDIPAFSADLGGPRAPINPRRHTDLVDFFGVKSVKFSGDRNMPAITLARIAYDTMQNFVLSADSNISAKHINKDEMGPLAPSNEQDELLITSLAQKMWDNIISPYDPKVRQLLIDQTHMFKNWALSKPNLREEDGKGGSIHGLSQIPDVLFLDEAQDINPAFLGLIRDQKKIHKNGLQVVAVGDTNQQIFGFRGTADSLGVIDRDITLPLTKSFRTGDGILKVANQVLGILGENLRLTGRDGDGSKIVKANSMNDPELVITRTNTGILAAGVWSDIIHPGERVATTAAFKDRLTVLVKTLDWLVGGGKPERRPKQISPELVGFTDYEQVLESADNGDPYMSMIVRMIGATKKQLAKKAGGMVSAFKTYEALKELDRIVGNFRILSDLFGVPDSVGKSGELGGNISYEIVKDKIILSNTRYMKHKRFGQGVWDNRGAIEDAGFKRLSESGEDGKNLMMWSAQVKGDVKKQLAELVEKLRGEDAIMRIMTGHTVKGLEAKKVRLWEDWKKPEDLSASEMRLYYVAITRAMDELDLGGLEWITSVGQDVDLIEDM